MLIKVRDKTVYEAVQWYPSIEIAGVYENKIINDGIGARMCELGYEEMTDISPGDWVILNSVGHASNCCTPDEFGRIYERVDG